MVDAQPGEKRLVLLTRDGYEHRYVANALSARFNIERIIVDRRSQGSNIRRAMRSGVSHFLGKAARNGFLWLIGDSRKRTLALRNLFGSTAETFDPAARLNQVDGVNSPETVALLRQIAPSAILVYGTTVVKDTVLSLAQDLCFNMHTGISPYYRGTACAFWPVANGEFDMLGATVHECTFRIDGGALFDVVRSSCEPGDDLHTVFGRSVVAGAEAYVRVIERYLAGTLQGRPQDLSLGREYRGADLTLRPELLARYRLSRLGTPARLPLRSPES